VSDGGGGGRLSEEGGGGGIEVLEPFIFGGNDRVLRDGG
jgi:hypothetical protein